MRFANTLTAKANITLTSPTLTARYKKVPDFTFVNQCEANGGKRGESKRKCCGK